ncbi:hypothetical protein DM02DRAFT_539770 [Periconia macrospinosa]|uniref:Uncharacterized protein n=1 Tax=Periconia macrospinosa TaxID=97972 RepID=A0A2V1D895_9PLEO|nr:hypothetical protein DM02DRAFT_539770 [Periconia macrospinosa]
MQLPQLLILAFAASASAAKFNFYADQSCQRYDETYVTVTAAQLQDLTVQGWPTTRDEPYASAFLGSPEEKKRCPSNSDDTFKWWSVGNAWGPGNGGAIAVVYYKETDTYNFCQPLASALSNGYAGFCK